MSLRHCRRSQRRVQPVLRLRRRLQTPLFTEVIWRRCLVPCHTPSLPWTGKTACFPGVAGAAAGWEDLTRWERAELGRALRRLGWTYGEIREEIPVPKGTLSYWCPEIRLAEEQVEAIKARTSGSRRGVPVDTQ